MKCIASFALLFAVSCISQAENSEKDDSSTNETADSDASESSGNSGSSGGSGSNDNSGSGDQSIVTCNGQPATCDDIGTSEEAFMGCCYNDSVYFCDEAGEFGSYDCTVGGGTCGFSVEDQFHDCLYED